MWKIFDTKVVVIQCKMFLYSALLFKKWKCMPIIDQLLKKLIKCTPYFIRKISCPLHCLFWSSSLSKEIISQYYSIKIIGVLENSQTPPLWYAHTMNILWVFILWSGVYMGLSRFLNHGLYLSTINKIGKWSWTWSFPSLPIISSVSNLVAIKFQLVNQMSFVRQVPGCLFSLVYQMPYLGTWPFG